MASVIKRISKDPVITTEREREREQQKSGAPRGTVYEPTIKTGFSIILRALLCYVDARIWQRHTEPQPIGRARLSLPEHARVRWVNDILG